MAPEQSTTIVRTVQGLPEPTFPEEYNTQGLPGFDPNSQFQAFSLPSEQVYPNFEDIQSSRPDSSAFYSDQAHMPWYSYTSSQPDASLYPSQGSQYRADSSARSNDLYDHRLEFEAPAATNQSSWESMHNHALEIAQKEPPTEHAHLPNWETNTYQTRQDGLKWMPRNRLQHQYDEHYITAEPGFDSSPQ